jgi:hypothetical protein
VIGLSLGVERQQYFGFPNFSSLFAAGETGVIFDPSTTGTLYQTTAMTIPATPGDPVGMMLDQSQWGGAALGALYGAELVTNGDFATDTDWTKGTGWTISGGAATVVAPGSTVTNLTQTIAITSGKTYKIEFTLSGATNLQDFDFILANGDGADLTYTANGTYSIFKTMAASASVIQFRMSGISETGDSVTIDNVSVREVTVANALAPILGPELALASWSSSDASWTVLAGDAVQAVNGVNFGAL